MVSERRHGTILASFDVYEPTISNESSKEARYQNLGSRISDLSTQHSFWASRNDSAETIDTVPFDAVPVEM
jgi:hypothetical protein